MQSQTILCDDCGETLIGPKAGVTVRKPHVYMKGVMSHSSFRASTGKWQFAYVTLSPEEEHHFCDHRCLARFAQRREEDFVSSTVVAPNMPHSDPMAKANHRGD